MGRDYKVEIYAEALMISIHSPRMGRDTARPLI